mgnify:CR=1 FL=1
MANNQNTILIQDPAAAAEIIFLFLEDRIKAIEQDEVFTVEQAADFAQVGRAQIVQAINSGELIARKVGDGKERERWRVLKSEVLNYIKNSNNGHLHQDKNHR